MSNLALSKYAEVLKVEKPDVFKRYLKKITPLKMDPFLLVLIDQYFNLTNVPPIQVADIYTYLVLSHKLYSNEQMKAYKSLDAHKYFESGFVKTLNTTKHEEHFLIRGEVGHSQKLNQKPLQVWIMTESDGSVVTGHCTCIAGAGEVCSHIGSALYAVEYLYRKVSTLEETGASACTSISCSWNVPKTQVTMLRVSEIDWNVVKGTFTGETPNVTVLKGKPLESFLQKFEQHGLTTVLGRLNKPPQIEFTPQLPELFNIYKKEYEHATYDYLLGISETYFAQLTLTTEDVENIEKNTIIQNKSEVWFNQRAGRVTATKFKRVCHTSLEKPSLTLIKEICYPIEAKFSSKSTDWGLKNEKKALHEYEERMKEDHINFSISDCGLIINVEYPHLAASPDSLASCECCGKGTVEVKCPFLLKRMTLQEFAAKNSTCLNITENGMEINQNHSYYYQVQLQMCLMKLLYCDFVIWSPQELFIERIDFDIIFCAARINKATKFHKTVILPELFGRYYTKKSVSNILPEYCLCKGHDDGRPMVSCSNDNCETQWFHADCVSFNVWTDTEFTCPACSMNIE